MGSCYVIFNVRSLIAALTTNNSGTSITTTTYRSMSRRICRRRLRRVSVHRPLVRMNKADLVSNLIRTMDRALNKVRIVMPRCSRRVNTINYTLLMSNVNRERSSG